MFENISGVATVLESTTGTAAEMTTALCQLGDGSMGEGITKMFGSGLEIGFTVGNLRGFVKGAATATAVIGGSILIVRGGIFISEKIKDRQKLKRIKQTDAIPAEQ